MARFLDSGELDWAESFHPLSLEIRLNFSGQAKLQQDKSIREVSTEQIATYLTVSVAWLVPFVFLPAWGPYTQWRILNTLLLGERLEIFEPWRMIAKLNSDGRALLSP